MAPSGTSASSPPVWSSLSALLNRSSNSLPRGNSAGDRHDGLRLRSACESHETLLSQRFGSGLSASAKQTKKEKDHAHDADERKAHEEKRDAADAPPAAPAKRSYHVPPVAPDFGQPNITVVGVGGAGCNAINNMISQGLEGVDFLVCNTDAQALSQSLAQSRVQLGSGLTHGLGAGASPEVGEGAARDSIDRVLEGIQSANMAFLTAGMGGGTGTGAAPVIAQALRDAGILTVAVVTTPFRFEGTRRMRIALQGLQELKDHVDTMIVIPNQNLFRIASPRTSLADAFRMADDVLYSGVRSVTDLMVLPGLINLDFADVRAVMSEMGQAMMGTGEAEGEDEARAVTAAEHAIKNPLLDNVSLAGARGVLINITGGPDMTLYEVDAAANRIREEVDEDANIIFGSAFDESMHGRVRVSVVATGIKDFNFDSN